MTDDEIDAVLDALIPDGTIIKRRDAGRLIYRAGMRRAAEIARQELLPTINHAFVDSYNLRLRAATVAIERAASDEREGGAE